MWFIGVTAGLMALPLTAVVGSSILWGILPFMLLAIWGVWTALQVSYRSGESWEQLTLTRDRLEVTRHDPGRADRHWQANPYWVRVAMRDGPVEDYLILSDGRRDIELGAFLSPEERRALLGDMQRRLAEMR